MDETVKKIHWPDGSYSIAIPGIDWLTAAKNAGFNIPTGCLSGSCGACEIEVNGKVVRACISSIPGDQIKSLKVELATDPYW